MALLDDEALERSSVVANNTMNRDRVLSGSNGYDRELGLDPVAELTGRAEAREGPVRWLDLCCGSGRALFAAAEALSAAGLAGRVEITGVDLVGHFAPARHPMVELVTASARTWNPLDGRRYDLITCVHGLHYLGDKLAVLARAAAWLTDTGRFAASFDTASIRDGDGGSAGRRAAAALRRAGFEYRPRSRRLLRRGAGTVSWPASYLGADPAAGPNYTGQPAVDSHYAFHAVTVP